VQLIVGKLRRQDSLAAQRMCVATATELACERLLASTKAQVVRLSVTMPPGRDSRQTRGGGLLPCAQKSFPFTPEGTVGLGCLLHL
jgi:hypothetical protein